MVGGWGCVASTSSCACGPQSAACFVVGCVQWCEWLAKMTFVPARACVASGGDTLEDPVIVDIIAALLARAGASQERAASEAFQVGAPSHLLSPSFPPSLLPSFPPSCLPILEKSVLTTLPSLVVCFVLVFDLFFWWRCGPQALLYIATATNLGPLPVVSQVLNVPQGRAAAKWRPLVAKVRLAERLLSEFGLEATCGLDVGPIMALVSCALNNSSAKARQHGLALLVRFSPLYKAQTRCSDAVVVDTLTETYLSSVRPKCSVALQQTRGRKKEGHRMSQERVR